MLTIEKANYTDEYERVRYFHQKFINTYGTQWPNIINDQAALIYLLNKFKITSVCEIGTWEGYTSLLIWLHPQINKQKAIDICANFNGGGNLYHKNLDKYGRYFKDITPVKLEKADTTRYIIQEEDTYDMVFIDGNHSYDFIKNDTALALKMQPKIISYHDYNNGNPGVDKFLNEWSNKVDLVLIENSAIIYFKL